MFLVYLVFILILSAYIYAKFRMYSEISDLNNNISEIQPRNVLFGMKKTQSFTIENINFVSANASYTMDIFHYLFKRLMLFFGINSSFFSYIVQLSYKRALVSIFERNYESDYILLNKVDFKHDGSRTITCVITGVAVRMYPETLPLFSFVPNFDPRINKVEQRHNFSHLINGLSIILIIFFILFGYLGEKAFYLAKNATFEDHEVLWSYLRYPVERNLHQAKEYQFAQQKIQKLLDEIEKPQSLESFDFKVYIIDDSDDIDMILLPAGNIVITSAMVERFDTENEIIFILAGAIYHYKDNYMLEALGKNYLSMNWIAKHFGLDSWIGRVFVFYRDFDNATYDINKEHEADDFAIEQLNKIYGHVGGLESLRFKAEQEIANEHNFFEKHLITNERLDRIAKLVEEKGYKYDLQSPVAFKIDKKLPTPEIVKIEPSQRSPADEFEDSFRRYRSELSSLQNSYYSEFRKLDGILLIENKATKEDLNSRVLIIDGIETNLKNYDKFYEDFFRRYDENNKEILERISDKDVKALNKAAWDKELRLSKENTIFILKRDRDVLQAQKAILKFLISRYGSYEIRNGNISFATEKERSDYKDLNDNLNDIVNRKQ